MNQSFMLQLTKWGRGISLAAGAAGLLWAGAAQGDDAVFQQAAYRLQEHIDKGYAPSPALEDPQAAEAAAVAAETPAGEEEEQPWTLQSLFDDDCGGNCFKDRGWEFGGFSQWGYQNRPDGAFCGNGPFLNQKEWGKFNLNQQYFYIGKVADGSKGFDWGFRTDLLFGVDGNEAQAFGNPPGTYDYLNGWDHGIYEWALPQLYGEIAYDKLSVKFGHFYTIVGYEVIPSNGNFFLSRQLTFYNSEPFTHTGVLGTYKHDDKLQIMSGWVAGWDTGFQQLNNSSSYIGGVIYQVAEKTTFTYTMTWGNLGWRGQGAVNSAILSHGWTDKLTTVHQFDVLGTNLGTSLSDPSNPIANDSIGFINYAFYQFNDHLKGGVRGEWYKADGESYYTATYGVNIFPCKNLVVRPEVRHMWSTNHNTYGTAQQFELFNQTVFGIDAIFTF